MSYSKYQISSHDLKYPSICPSGSNQRSREQFYFLQIIPKNILVTLRVFGAYILTKNVIKGVNTVRTSNKLYNPGRIWIHIVAKYNSLVACSVYILSMNMVTNSSKRKRLTWVSYEIAIICFVSQMKDGQSHQIYQVNTLSMFDYYWCTKRLQETCSTNFYVNPILCDSS